MENNMEKKSQETTSSTDELKNQEREEQVSAQETLPNNEENNSTTEPLEVITVEPAHVEKVEEQPVATVQEEQKQHTTSNTTTESQKFNPIPETPNRKKGNFFKRHRTASLLIACLLLSGVGSFGGFYLAQSMNRGGNGVTYQPVIRTASTNDSERVTGLSAKDVAAAAMNSVVEIRTESVQGGSFMRQYISEGAGSGVILSENGHIVTNHHVINGANKITVRTKDGTEYEATLLGSDAATDLAVLKIEATGLSPATLGDSSKLSVGDKAYAIGNPLGELGGTVTDGIISALDRELTIDGQSMRLLQTSAAINPGNSGGGLFNDAGELIGIVNAKSSGSDIEGLGFAIPINSAKQIIESLLNNGYVQNRPQLGITLVNITDEMTAYRNGVSTLGVYIDSVAPSSGAANANLQAKDRIISINGAEVKTSADIKKVIDQLNVGDVVKLQIARDERIIEVDVTLTESKPQQ